MPSSSYYFKEMMSIYRYFSVVMIIVSYSGYLLTEAPKLKPLKEMQGFQTKMS